MDDVKYHMHVGNHRDAKSAITHYVTKRTVGRHSLVEVRIDTGRQHQIRAHMSWLGNPVVGDSRYGNNGHRMGLHALSLAIIHPVTRKRLTFETPVPLDFSAILK
jgi:23S rRNA pseudouridine1911/1915/1917 synthase